MGYCIPPFQGWFIPDPKLACLLSRNSVGPTFFPLRGWSLTTVRLDSHFNYTQFFPSYVFSLTNHSSAFSRSLNSRMGRFDALATVSNRKERKPATPLTAVRSAYCWHRSVSSCPTFRASVSNGISCTSTRDSTELRGWLILARRHSAAISLMSGSSALEKSTCSMRAPSCSKNLTRLAPSGCGWLQNSGECHRGAGFCWSTDHSSLSAASIANREYFPGRCRHVV